jgi:hypothetical protein
MAALTSQGIESALLTDAIDRIRAVLPDGQVVHEERLMTHA